MGPRRGHPDREGRQGRRRRPALPDRRGGPRGDGRHASGLRQRGDPEWDRPTDLALPADFPDDLASLAKDIVKGRATPYDKALALQDYFRHNEHFRYSTEVAAGQDTGDPPFLQRG